MRFSTVIASLITIAFSSAAAVPHKTQSCGAQGFIARTGVQINGTAPATSVADCSTECLNNAACKALSFDSSNGCKLYTAPVQYLQFSSQANANALFSVQSKFYNKSCFNGTATATSSSAPSTTVSATSTPAATSAAPSATPSTCTSTTVGGITYNQYFAGNGVALASVNPGLNSANPKEGRYVKEILYGTTNACEAIQTCAGLSQFYGWVFGSFDVHYMQAEQLWICSTFPNAVTADEMTSSWTQTSDVGVAFGFSM